MSNSQQCVPHRNSSLNSRAKNAPRSVFLEHNAFLFSLLPELQGRSGHLPKCAVMPSALFRRINSTSDFRFRSGILWYPRNNKLLGTSATLVVTSALLVATRSLGSSTLVHSPVSLSVSAPPQHPGLPSRGCETPPLWPSAKLPASLRTSTANLCEEVRGRAFSTSFWKVSLNPLPLSRSHWSTGPFPRPLPALSVSPIQAL